MENSRIIKHKIGAHLSIQKNKMNIFSEAEDLCIKTIGCFTASNIQYSEDKVIEEVVGKKFSEKIISGGYTVFSHAPYVINIANKSKEEIYKRSVASILSELERCTVLNISGMVVHAGSNHDKKAGASIVADSLEEILQKYSGTVKIILENSAGQGFSLPSSLEDIASIYNFLSKSAKKRVKIALDTCHLHSYGYNISYKEGVKEFLEKCEDLVGFKNVEIIHLNDSLYVSGSRKDRHESIGEGTIGLKGFSFFLNDERVVSIPKILETPVETYLDWKKDLEVLESILN